MGPDRTHCESSRGSTQEESPCTEANGCQGASVKCSEPQQPSYQRHIKNSWCLEWMSAFQAEILKKIKCSSGYCPSNWGKWLRKTQKKGYISSTDRMHMFDLLINWNYPWFLPSKAKQPHLTRENPTRPDTLQQKSNSAAHFTVFKEVSLVKHKVRKFLFVCLELENTSDDIYHTL